MTWSVAIGAVVVGIVSGALSGAVGVGGAVVSTPGIRVLGAPPLIAVGTTLPAIVPSAATGIFNYARAGLIDFRVAAICAGTGSVAAVGGAYTSNLVGGKALMLITAVLLAENSLRMARDARRLRREQDALPPEPDTENVTEFETDGYDASADESDAPAAVAYRRSPQLIGAIGVAAGFVSGLLGVGGGVVIVPAFYRILGMPVKRTVATSLLVVGILAVPGTISHARLAHINWAFAGLLAAGVVPGAYLGSRFTVRTDEIRLRQVVAAALAAIAVVYAAGELAPLIG